jgi:predicted transcriptional regulator
MIALVSIKPRYVNLILSGEKTIELRRVFNSKITKVYLYSSSPVQRIVAACDVKPDMNVLLFCGKDRICQLSCVTHKEFDNYFADEYFNFIHIKSVRPISATLADIGLKRPPQNYMFLSDEQIKILEIKK